MDQNEEFLFRQRIKARFENHFGSAFLRTNEKQISSFLDSVMEMISQLVEQERKAAIPISPAAHKVEDYQNIQAQKDAHFADCKLSIGRAKIADDPAARYALYANMLFAAGVESLTPDLLHAIDKITTMLNDWSAK